MPQQSRRSNAAGRATPALRRPMSLEVGGLLGVVALCLAVRVVNLGALPIFFDEAGYIRAAQLFGLRPGPATLLASLNYGAPPLFAWLAAPFTLVISDPLLAVRVASAVIGTLALPAVWATARSLWGGSTAFLAALLYALAPFVVFYNRLAIIDGLVATCGAGALYCAVRLSRHGRGRDSVLLGLCLVAGLLAKIFSASMLLLPLLALVAAWPEQRRAVRRGAIVAALIGVLPLVALLLTPQGSGLLSATHAHAAIRGSQFTVVGRQLVTWGSALWLYLTPPILLLALLGLWATRRERIIRLVGAWALLGGLPPALVPGAFLAPRYFLYIAVPIVILAARGLIAIATAIYARAPRLRAAWVPAILGLALAALAAIPALQADAALATRPATAPLIPFDRWQYVTGWPSGYALNRVVAYLRRQESGGPLTVVSSIYNPPGDALAILMGRDRAVTLANVDFSALPNHPLRATPGRRTFVIACRPYGQPLRADPRHLRPMLRVPNRSGGGVDVYEVTAQ